MDEAADGPAIPRQATPEDVALIARRLAEEQVEYVLIGGFAMLLHGSARPTQDIDLLVDPSPKNVERIRRALSVLADNAVFELEPTDIENYTVVRVADEVVVDLLGSACGLTLADLEDQVQLGDIAGTPVRYLSAAALIRTKQTVRPKDADDCLFLAEVVAGCE